MPATLLPDSLADMSPAHLARLLSRDPPRQGPLLFAGVWAVSAVLGYALLYRGWIPHDAGVLGHAAERVLAGELPHRDFVDVYTGGRAHLNALAFRVLGVSVTTLRLVFFVAYLLWIPTVWYVARTFARPQLAAAVTLLAATLTLPVYAEGMPGWYNLFLATAGVASLLRYLERRHIVWLVLAGVAGGASILFKIVGLYYVAGTLVFFLHLEASEGPTGGTASNTSYRVAALTACAIVSLLALYVVLTGSARVGLIYFALPPLAAVAGVATSVGRSRGRPSIERFSRLLGLALPFAAGVLVPVILFSLPYLGSGSLGTLYEGVFVLPRLRFEFAARDSLPILVFLPAIALVVWVASAPMVRTVRDCLLALVVGGAVLTLVMMSHIDVVYRVVWWTLTSLGPVGAWILVRRTGHGRGTDSGSGALLVLAVFGFCNLVQIPFAAPIYFLYAAPLLLLVSTTLVAHGEPASREWFLFVTIVLIAFSVWRLDTGFLYHLGFRYRAHRQTEALTLERARGIRVRSEEKGELEELVRSLGSLDAGPSVLALPDAPEVYFLTGLRNPTRTLVDFFEDSEDRSRRILSLIDDTGLQVVVLNRRRLLSPPVEGPLLDSLEARFRWSAEVGRFRILWKGPNEPGDTGFIDLSADPSRRRL